tara:strand:+ start:61 stop:642 length:582 start_codon:yes stop_codon:yes gene_type:complete
MARLTIKDQQARYDKIMKGYEEGKKAGLTIAAGDHQGGAYRKPHLEGADHDYIKELYKKRQNPRNPLDGDELPGGDMQLKLPLAHNIMDTDSLIDKWGATILPDGETWMIPTKEGTLRPATEEETLMLNEDLQHRQMYDRLQPHPHQASIYMGEQFPNEFDRVLNPTGAVNPPRPSLDQLREGVRIKKKTKAI